MSDKVRAVSNEMVQDGYQWFTGLVAERRKMPIEQVRILADGRAYTGRQALAVKLIDTLGGEEKALAWLAAERKVTTTKIINWEPKKDEGLTGFGVSLGSAVLEGMGLGALRSEARRVKLDGLLVLWHPAL